MLSFLGQWGSRLAGAGEDGFLQRRAKSYSELYPLACFLPYQAFDPAKGLFYNDGSVGFVLETAPLVGCSPQMQREIAGLFQNTLPEGSCLQFLLWADPCVGGLLSAWQNLRDGSAEIYQQLAHKLPAAPPSVDPISSGLPAKARRSRGKILGI